MFVVDELRASELTSIMDNLDIVIVNWNTGDLLRECLHSISSATSTNAPSLDRCIVVDNASTDHSADSLDGLPLPLTLVVNHENKGFAHACNQGAKLGKADYILFLNPDMSLFEKSLLDPLAFLNRSAADKIGILGIQLVDPAGTIQRNTARFPTPKILLGQMLGLDRLWPDRFPGHFLINWDHQESRQVDQVPGAFYLVRRKLFEELGGFDERFFMYFEDLDFAYRAKKKGWNTYYLADTRAIHHGGGASDQVKAKRLVYIMNSRLLYTARHFGTLSVWAILLVGLTGELGARLVWSLVHRSSQGFQETLKGYALFIRGLPQLLRNIKRDPECASLP